MTPDRVLGRRGARPHRTRSARRPNGIRLTSGADRREHTVTDTAFAEALQTSAGHCDAICGHRVVMTSLATPPGPSCPRCTRHPGLHGDDLHDLDLHGDGLRGDDPGPEP